MHSAALTGRASALGPVAGSLAGRTLARSSSTARALAFGLLSLLLVGVELQQRFYFSEEGLHELILPTGRWWSRSDPPFRIRVGLDVYLIDNAIQ